MLMGALRLIMAKGIYLPLSVLHDRGERSTAPSTPPAAAAPAHARLAPASASGGSESRPPLEPAALGLTPRQSDVLYQILQGRSAKLIGRELSLSPSTVKAHTSAVLRALNVTTRTQAVVAASRLGLRF
jgi:DNA-binding NarL/FixJ family response regulator